MSDIFRSTAPYYARYRPGYPTTFFQAVVTRFGLDGTGRSLDLGCGTGQLTIPLARYVATMIGMDPEPAMLTEARRVASEAGVEKIVWIEGGSDDLLRLRDRLAGVRLVTMGRSFHWMESERTLVALAQLLVPGGGIVLIGDPCGPWSDALPWQQAIKRTVQRWLGERRRAGSGAYTREHEPWSVLLAHSPFSTFEPYELHYTRAWTLDNLIGCLYSTSFCSPHVLGADRPAFERDLRDALLALEPAGTFQEEVELSGYFAWSG